VRDVSYLPANRTQVVLLVVCALRKRKSDPDKMRARDDLSLGSSSCKHHAKTDRAGKITIPGRCVPVQTKYDI
jgi:hypothetical protein